MAEMFFSSRISPKMCTEFEMKFPPTTYSPIHLLYTYSLKYFEVCNCAHFFVIFCRYGWANANLFVRIRKVERNRYKVVISRAICCTVRRKARNWVRLRCTVDLKEEAMCTTMSAKCGKSSSFQLVFQ